MRHTTILTLVLFVLLPLAGVSCGMDGNSPDSDTPDKRNAGSNDKIDSAQHDGAAGSTPAQDNEVTGVAQDQYEGTTGGSTGEVATSLVEDLSGKQVEVASASASVPPSDFNTTSPSPEAVLDYLNYVVENNDQVWTQYFTNAGLQEPRVSYWIVMPGETYTSACTLDGEQMTVEHDTPNAYYCSQDELNPGYTGTIYLPITTMTKMWNGDIFGKQAQQQGDFAAATIAAHEFGHHMVDEIRIQTSQRDGFDYPEPTGKYNELIADCMAGVWAASAYYQGFLDEQRDFDAAVTALYAIGDEVGSHGTSDERMEALRTGYDGISGVTEPGSPEACVQKYWVTSP